MTFASHVLLWSLLALLPLVAVYFLKVRPRRRPTTAFFLWQQVLTDRKPNRLWERLRNIASLAMMAAAFGAIALGMAGPRLGQADENDLLIVIDNSLSMSADSGGGSRLELAKEAARDLARGMNGVQRAAVATAADRLRYVSHLTDNPRELIAAIDQVKPTYETLRIDSLPHRPAAEAADNAAEAPSNDANAAEDADLDATPAAESKSERRIVFVTDGAHADLPGGVEPLLVGDVGTNNIGIVAADLRFAPDDPSRLILFYQVASTHGETRAIDLLLFREDLQEERTIAKVIPLEVSPGENAPAVVAIDDAEPGRWVLELDEESLGADDALLADNTAYLVAYQTPPIRVQVATEDAYFFERAVEAFSNFGGGLRPTTAGEDAQVAILYGSAESDASHAIVFAPTGESRWWEEAGETVEVLATRVSDEKHPVLRDIDPLSLPFVGARRLVAPPGSELLLESDAGVPLIYLTRRSGEAAIVFNLDPVQADFFYSAWFPVLVRASAQHLVGRSTTLAATHTPATQVTLPLQSDALPVELTTPAGENSMLSAPLLSGLREPGFYRVSAADNPIDIACSPLSASETLIGARVEAEPLENLASGPRLGYWLVVAALGAVTAESLLYHRRKVG